MILHIMTLEKFTPLFIHFVEENIGCRGHKFVFITSKRFQYGLEEKDNAEFLHTDADFCKLRNYMFEAEKIILHSLKRDKVHKILRLEPALLAKSIWVMWGGDFYSPSSYNNDHLYVIKNVPYMVNILDEEITMVQRIYGCKGKHIRTFFYNTTLYSPKSITITKKKKTPLHIMLGHSAVPENRHIQYLEVLKQKDDGQFIVKCPLVYPNSNEDYKVQVIEKGKSLFGARFEPLLEFMPLDDYLLWMETVDIAILPSSRQHGMGNLVNLLGSGKKVFIDDSVSTWSFFKRLGVSLYSLEELEFTALNNDIAADNHKTIAGYFSKERLTRDLKAIFDLRLGEELELDMVKHDR
ncbi:TDP-N-acetylfucosamine:lipid II N-acetylfucosaminyltransferase [Alteromonas naphthalenivorans]|jgi:hypothetical protein|uniref:4-alpha-L-fucosyltransferase n=1 Tax=Alteromonas naphthalenivorans TaxID=715451 RepID=F5ZE86_ALTNA|nr:TDP-N-acetylfucosamine:lipid II N-acetylfucosaminyltransferase [Alteromonas naphthalenivorans]AEF04198.1 4-alpha-L-fucosyltransferase [Alteromonas naphthalenivorans]